MKMKMWIGPQELKWKKMDSFATSVDSDMAVEQ
jgi:hypothetical protein